MALRRSSLILPGYHLEDFPTHLAGERAAELLSAWTSLWHPSLLAETGVLPAWHPAGAPPDPDMLEGELVIAPHLSRERLPTDWVERFGATVPRNPVLIEPFPSREKTLIAVLEAASLDPQAVDRDLAGDFFALGYAYLQIELLTRVMRHTTLLNVENFCEAAIEAARAAVQGDRDGAHDNLSRAFDLLSDARNHYYPVDYYLLDVTLAAPSTLGHLLREKLASGCPTSVLASGALIEQMALEHPATLDELRRAMDAGTACVVGGRMHGGAELAPSPEDMLSQIEAGQAAYRKHLGREVTIFAQHETSFSTLMPTLLSGLGFRGALHASFDGGSLPQANQPKTWWCGPDGKRIEAISTTALDVARPETWLALAQRAGDSLAHDHISTILFAGWAGHASEFADDLRSVSKYSSLLGKLVTLEEYFRVSREVDDWITFQPREYARSATSGSPVNPLSTAVDAYRRSITDIYQKIVRGCDTMALLAPLSDELPVDQTIVLNPWSFARPVYMEQSFCPAVPACGFARRDATASPLAAPLVEGRTLRNERVELVVSEATGGIQSIRSHSNRSTRASQRLVFCDRRTSGRAYRASEDDETPEANVRMVAERVEETRCDEVVGEITSQGQLLSASDVPLARFRQSIRVMRGVAAAIVDVAIVPERAPDANFRNSYFASRLVWRDDALALRRGVEWSGRETRREWIDTPEWVEIMDGAGTITLFSLGLPLHRHVGHSRLDTLLAVAGEARSEFRFAIGLDAAYPTQMALVLAAIDEAPTLRALPPPVPREGWFLHASARNVVMSHLAALEAPRSGVQLRLLETEGRDAEVTLQAFRAIRSGRFTDFRGAPSEVTSCGTISVVDGQARLAMAACSWVEVELEW